MNDRPAACYFAWMRRYMATRQAREAERITRCLNSTFVEETWLLTWTGLRKPRLLAIARRLEKEGLVEMKQKNDQYWFRLKGAGDG